MVFPARGNYVILLTDGLESARLKGGVPDYDAAAKEAADLLSINVKTYVIGFGQDVVGNQTLSNIANAGGTQKAYFAADLAQLKEALRTISRQSPVNSMADPILSSREQGTVSTERLLN